MIIIIIIIEFITICTTELQTQKGRKLALKPALRLHLPPKKYFFLYHTTEIFV